MSAAEKAQAAQSTRNGWLLSTPALVILTLFAVGPLMIVAVYSPPANTAMSNGSSRWTAGAASCGPRTSLTTLTGWPMPM